MSDPTPVYCRHSTWETFGPDTFRCYVCGAIWYKFKEPNPPKTIIGFMEVPPPKAQNRKEPK